ncbi:MAG: hypothetical protein KAX78_06140, partial [Phycisphaerae bacterium]|nr:hypothetical protein [Phycisphaerae bacterium]
TATRPPAEDYATAVQRRRLNELASIFDPPAEVIADFRAVHKQREFAAGRQGVLELLRRRPCSIVDIAGGLGMHRNEVIKYLEELKAENLIEQLSTEGSLFYKAKP